MSEYGQSVGQSILTERTLCSWFRSLKNGDIHKVDGYFMNNPGHEIFKITTKSNKVHETDCLKALLVTFSRTACNLFL